MIIVAAKSRRLHRGLTRATLDPKLDQIGQVIAVGSEVSRQVNIYEAKTRLSQLVAEVSGGEEIIIARAGKPVARLVPYHAPVPARHPGLWRGRVSMSPDFDQLPAELEAAFRGERD